MTTENTNKRQVVVSLTTFPAAVTYAIDAIKSILTGSALPDKLVLYLVSSEWVDVKLPEELLRMEQESELFEIRYHNRSTRSYTKLVPALIDFPEAIIVTIDDDIRYHRHLLRDLLCWHDKYPKFVLAHRVRKIDLSKPYRKWKKYHWYDFLFKQNHAGFQNLLTGVGGVLYPPHSLREDMLDANLFMNICPTTDDIWFWAASVANNTPVMPIPFGYNKPKELPKPNNIRLMTTNYRGQDDRNLAALTAVLEQYPEIKEKLYIK